MAGDGAKKEKKRTKEVVAREYTINLHKALHGTTFKKRAPKAIKVVKAFAQKAMKTKEVRVDTELNKQLWSNGIRNVPRRVRVKISRKRNDDDDAKEEFVSLVEFVDVGGNFHDLGTKKVE